jgi:coenzyme PQQ precursor peptide PqqA
MLSAASGPPPRSVVTCTREERAPEMKWTKPEFELVDLCLEVTTYVYRR